MTVLQQSEVELRVFNAFAEHGPLSIDLDSIENRETPEPDILCTVGDIGPVAFEMTAIVDEGVARRWNERCELVDRFYAACQSLPDHERARLENTENHVAFADDASIRDKRAAVPKIIELLLNQSRGFDGEIELPDEYRATIQRVHVHRTTGPPAFSVGSFGNYRDPIVERIGAKLQKSYGGQHRKELLAYYSGLQIDHLDLVEPEVEALLADDLPQSPFERVWIFDWSTQRVLRSYP